jgi:hypothetical protein
MSAIILVILFAASAVQSGTARLMSGGLTAEIDEETGRW